MLLLLLALYTATWPRARLLHADLAVKSSETLLNRTLGEERGLSHTNSNARFTLLVFSKTAAYRHASISAGKELLQQLATDNNFAVQFSEDANSFTDAALAEVDGVLFLNTTGNILNSEQQTAFERFIQAGNGYIGVHSASDTEYDWSWYGKLVGAYFDSHPAIQDATVTIRDTHHPSTTMLPDPWLRQR
ncbi:MAG: ThuA domain-containing protein [Caldilineaceae bacterium]